MRTGMTRRGFGIAWVLGMLGAVAAMAMIFGVGRSGTAVAQEEEAPAAPTGEIGVAAIAEMPERAVTYVIQSEESKASYTVEEELAGQGDIEAVGETNAVIGEIVFDADGNPLAGSRIDIDLRTLVSPETRRDNYLRTNSLESDTYPLATFVVTGVENWAGPLEEGQTSEFQLVGNLTVHGVTREVVWESTATRDEDVISGTATVSVEMGDFEIEKPSVGIVLSLDETVKLDLSITAASAE